MCVNTYTHGSFWKPLVPQASSFPTSTFPGFLIYLLLVPIIIPCSIWLYSIPMSLNVFSKCHSGSSSGLETLQVRWNEGKLCTCVKESCQTSQNTTIALWKQDSYCSLWSQQPEPVSLWPLLIWGVGHVKQAISKCHSTLSPQCSNFLGFPLVVVSCCCCCFLTIFQSSLKVGSEISVRLWVFRVMEPWPSLFCYFQ